MKPFVKYISLLIFSGLILPFYNSPKASSKSCRVGRTLSQVFEIKTAPFIKFDKVSPPVGGGDLQGASAGFSIFKDIAGELFPVLKNLN
jgi:hypothetical protein